MNETSMDAKLRWGPLTAVIAACLVSVCTAVLPSPASAASWRSVGAGRDTVLTDLEQGLDGSRHVVVLERRAGAGATTYDVIDRELAENGTLGGPQSVVGGMAEVSAARLIPTAKGLVALVSGKQAADDRTSVTAFLAPLGGGAWAPIDADDAYLAAGDTFLGEIAQLFTGASAARIVEGPPIAAFPDGSLLVPEQSSSFQFTLHRALTGQAPTPSADITPAATLGADCAMNVAAPGTDSLGNAYVVYGAGAFAGGSSKCKDALVRQQVDPATLAPVGSPVALAVPSALGGARSLEVKPGAVLVNNHFEVFSGPDGRPWVMHTLHVEKARSRRVELALWDADGRMRLVPRFKAKRSTPDPVLPGTRAKPAVRAFPNGDLVVAYETASQRLYHKACPNPRKRCMYGLTPPAIAVARLHGRKWTIKELPGPRYRKRNETFGALRLLGDSSSSVDLAVESDVKPKTSDPSQVLATEGAVYLQHVRF